MQIESQKQASPNLIQLWKFAIASKLQWLYLHQKLGSLLEYKLLRYLEIILTYITNN